MVIELKIDPEFESLIPLSNEYDALEKSIVVNGYDKTCPIRIWKGHDVIVDGHNRYKVCKKHGIVDFTTLEMKLYSREAVRDWMYREQLTRRNLDKLQRTYFMGMVYKAEKHPKGTNQHSNEDGGKSAILKKESTAERIGKLFHVSSDTVKEAEKFANSVNEYAKNSDVMPYQLLSTFSNEIKTTQSEIVDVSKNFSSEDQKAAYYLIKEKKADSLSKAMNILGKSRQKKSNEGAGDTEHGKEGKEPEQRQKNAYGKYNASPEPFETRIIRVKHDHIFAHDNELQCGIEIGKEFYKCQICPVKGKKDIFRCRFPVIKNLIMDFREVFPSMMAFISDSPVDEDTIKEMYFEVIFFESDWNTFAEKYFPLLVIPKTEQVKEPETKEPVKEEPAKARVQKTKKDVKPKEKQTSKEKKPKQNYTQYDTQIPKCVTGLSLNVHGLIEALGLKDQYESLDFKGKHAMEQGIYKHCKTLVKNGILELDEITSKEEGSAHYIAKSQSNSNVNSEKMAI